MADARNLLTPRYEMTRTVDCIAVQLDKKYLFRIYPRTLNFQVDIMEPGSQAEADYKDIVKKQSYSKKVYGVFGYINFASLGYLVLIEEASLIGQVIKANVFRVEKLMFLPLKNDQSRTVPKEDQVFIDMINKIQKERAFYFSYDMDLTSNQQKTLLETQDHQETSSTPGIDVGTRNFLMMKQTFPHSVEYIPYFAFNDNMLAEFAGIEYAPFKVPCIMGYVYISSPNIAGSKLDFILISRKDCRRPGRRFITRGLDREGNAANFVETEHIFVQYDIQQRMKIASFVQIRGSIPLIWTMKPNLKWSPPVIVSQNFDDSRIAAEFHFRETIESYGPQYMVNLIDKKGSQKRIGDQFSRLFGELRNKKLNYTWFDFHDECKKMKWENLSKLVNICKSELNEYGYFMAQIHHGYNEKEAFYGQKNIIVIQTQKGTFRSNCMDCLDRTNVVQGVFSRYIAHHQLEKLNLNDMPKQLGAFEKFPSALEDHFRCGWTNNADVLSYLYTGTPALKTDFTRTGKRTHQGAMNDGINSVTRYYINNFTDGYYHDCLDIATMKLLPSNYMKPRGQVTAIKICLFVLFVAVVMAKLFADSFFEIENAHLWGNYTMLMHKGSVFVCFALGMFAILKNGSKFVDDASRFV